MDRKHVNLITKLLGREWWDKYPARQAADSSIVSDADQIAVKKTGLNAA
jgi:hypothetical protein